MGLFVHERGSTSITVVISVVLAITLMALSVQSYWVLSGSTDIQDVADYGALAGADAVAKIATTVQVLDAILLAMNVFGLVLHGTIVVGGVAVAAGVPVGGASLAPLLTKLIEFNKKYLDMRKEFAQSAYVIAERLNEAAPYIAMAQSWEVIRANATSLNSFNGHTYTGMAVPLPFNGSVSLSGYPDEVDALAGTVTEAGESNGTDAKELAELQKEIEHARLQCYEADQYRPSGVSAVGWEPAFAIEDYEHELERLAQRSPAPPLDPQSIEGSPSANGRLADCFTRDYAAIGAELLRRFRYDSSRSDGDGYLMPRTVSVTSYLGTYGSTSVLVVPHAADDRRAYHSDANCFGLLGASEDPLPTPLSELFGDDNHPPCSLCKPLHWGAVEEWRSALVPFASFWNQQVALTLDHEQLRRDAERLESEIAERTEDAFGDILAQASGYLLGGRITYHPSGSRGFLCVVVGSSGRMLPKYSLPALTGTATRRMGRQIALSGARVLPTSGQHAAVNYLKSLGSKTSAVATIGAGGAINVATGQGHGVSQATNPLWRSALGHFSGGSSLKSWFAEIPWGVGEMGGSFMNEVLSVAGVSPPDLRQLAPVLVSAADVGDPATPGPEGSIARALSQVQGAYVSGADPWAVNVGDEIIELLSDAGPVGYVHFVRLFSVALMDKAVAVPFSSSQTKSINESISWTQYNMTSVLAPFSGRSGE